MLYLATDRAFGLSFSSGTGNHSAKVALFDANFTRQARALVFHTRRADSS
jgi:hypothetical protein